MIRAEYQKKGLETLVESVDTFVYDILRNIETDEKGKQKIDAEVLSDIVEGFAGRAYVVNMRLKNQMALSEADREYLSEVLDKHYEQTVV